jgi:hypothetical protein
LVIGWFLDQLRGGKAGNNASDGADTRAANKIAVQN